MKYAAIRSTTRDTRRKNNIGETIIDLAMEEIYKYMGVPEDDLVYIEKPYLSNYDGETVILPIVKGYPEHQSISKAFPKSIIPVFLCWSLLGGSLNPEDVPYLKAHEPIGCRDEQTLRECEKYGINAYLNGCITICFPKVNYNPNGKVYMVDVPQELIKYIPNRSILRSDIFKIANEFDVSVTHAAMQAVLSSNAENEILICYDQGRLKWYTTASRHIYPRMVPKRCPVDLEAAQQEVDIAGAWCDLYQGTVHQEKIYTYGSQHLILLSGDCA